MTVDVNYEILTNRTYVTNYDVKPLPVVIPSRPVYFPEVLMPEVRYNYIEVVKSCSSAEVQSVINIIDSKTVSHPLYKEVVLQVETPNRNYFVKLILENGKTTHQCVDVSPVDEPEVETSPEEGEEVPEICGELPEDMVPDQTSTTTDGNGNVVIVTTDEKELETKEEIKVTKSEITKKYAKYAEHKVKYAKTVNFGLVDEVVMTMVNPSSGIVDTKSVSFYNKETKVTTIVSVEPIEKPSVEQPVLIRPLFPQVTISDSGITEIVKKDQGMKKVMTTITSSSSSYKSAIPKSVEVQQIGTQTNKYVVVLDVNGKKEQKVYTHNVETGETVHYATTAVPSVVIPRRVVQTVVDNKKVTVSNSVKQVEIFYPETKKVGQQVKKEIKDVKDIQSVTVVAQSSSTAVTFVTKGETSKQVLVKEYTSKDNQVTKVEDHVVQIGEISRPVPTTTIAVNPEVIYQVPCLESDIKKAIKMSSTRPMDKKQIKLIKVSKNTNVPVYEVKVADESGKEVTVEIVHNTATQECTVIDVAEVQSVKPVSTTTQVKSISGVTEVTTTNTETIKESKEFKQITTFLEENHPEENIAVAVPVIDVTDKFQRSIVKTVVFTKETTTIQATYVLDQRTRGIVEIDYQTLSYVPSAVVEIPSKPKDVYYTSFETLREVVRSNSVVKSSIESINRIDSTLESLAPTYIHLQIYAKSTVVTIIYDTPRSNSRILVIFNEKTQESKVVDYTKIKKNIEPYTVV